jgi:DNA-binding response OmpR family regulator
MDRRVAVVVEDDDDIRELLSAVLGQSGFDVHEAFAGREGVEAVRAHDPAVVTVDLGLPDIDGYEVTRRLRQFTDAYVVMLTARADEIDTLQGLDAGADDYVTKPFRPRELRARIEAMLRRPRELGTPTPSPGTSPAGGRGASEPPTSGGTADHAAAPAVPAVPAPAAGTAEEEVSLRLDGLALFPRLHQVVVDGAEVALTPTEFTLLETLLRSGRVVRTKEELARAARGGEADDGTFVSRADERTVEVHLGNLRRKLADDPREPRWLETVRGVGYRAAGTVTKTL